MYYLLHCLEFWNNIKILIFWCMTGSWKLQVTCWILSPAGSPAPSRRAWATVKYREMLAEWELSDERLGAMCQWIGHGCFWDRSKVIKIKTEHSAAVPYGYVLFLAKEDTREPVGWDQKGSHHTSGPAFIQCHFREWHTTLLCWSHSSGGTPVVDSHWRDGGEPRGLLMWSYAEEQPLETCAIYSYPKTSLFCIFHWVTWVRLCCMIMKGRGFLLEWKLPFWRFFSLSFF